MSTIESRLMAEGPQYRADYLEALRMLNGKPQLLLPAPNRPTERYDEDNPYDVVPLHLTPYNVPIVEHEPDPESRADMLSRIVVRKSVRPMIREVMFDGATVGKIARNPYGPGWVASCNRHTMYWSIQDAALALVEDFTEAAR